MSNPTSKNPRVFDPRHFGARGDGLALDTAALQAAIDACGEAGGGCVVVPPGRYLIAPIDLRSHVTLHLEAGATLLGTPERPHYRLVTRRYSGTTQLTIDALVNAVDCERVAITGRGTVDGQGEAFWKPIRDYYAVPKEKRPPPQPMPTRPEEVQRSIWHRPRLVEFERCRDVRVEGVTLQNSGFWNLHLISCDVARVEGVNLRNPPGACNGDGIDLDSCRNVFVLGCDLDVNDDCICLKSGWNEAGLGPTENVVIANCVTRRGHGGVVIGSDMSGGVRNVTVSNCLFIGTETGFRMKSMRGRGGLVENLLASNVVMDRVPHPFHFDMHYARPMPPEPLSERTPRFRNFSFHQVEATGAEQAAYLHGLEECPLEGVRMVGVRIAARKAFWARHVAALELQDVRLACEEGPELQVEDGRDLRVHRLEVAAPRSAGPSIRFTRIRGASLSRDSAGSVQRVEPPEGEGLGG
ncbi:MAG: glycoside hydrolase family 28 protein [Verrucomicrobiae bacterium]|nr:glycoside hydrolase family 28 protein [Verrucomicrobiae bacterium]